MTCESAESLIGSYLDGELNPSEIAQLEEHFAACPACAQALVQQETLRSGIRKHAPYHRAPVALRKRISADLRRTQHPASRPWAWVAIAAAIALAVTAAFITGQMRQATYQRDQIAQSLVASHVRSLMGTHLLDVPSSDRHTVKPWFNGKLDFSPDVKDLAAQGFPLIGGRIDFVGDRTVAALVYQRRQHIINLYTWPAAVPAEATDLRRNGYRIQHWNAGGMEYWAVSDVGIEELRQFQALYTR